MRNKKSVLSALLAAVLLVACVAGMLITGVSAEEPTHKVLEVDGVGASGSGKYKTVTAALQSVDASTWASGSTLTIEISAEDTVGESLNKVGKTSGLFMLFSEATNFLSDGTKLPITIRSTYIPDGEEEARSALRFLNWGYGSYNYVFANDYTFENVDLYLSKSYQSAWNSDGSRKITSASDYFFAGCGEVAFKNVRFCRSNYQYVAADKSDSSTTQGIVGYTINSKNTTFYGDLYADALGDSKGTEYLNGIFHNWDAEKLEANKGEDGLLKTGFTFDDVTYYATGSAGGSPSTQTWQRAYVAASYGGAYEYTKGEFSVSNEDIHAYITVTGDSLMTRVNGFRSNATIIAPAKVSLNINGNATVYGVFADSGNGGSYHDSNWDAYVSNTRKVNVEINISENALIKGNNGSSADSCSISGVSDATYTEDSRVVININGGTIEQEIVAVGGHNIATGKAGEKFYNLPLNTAGEFEINIRGGEFKDAIYGIFSKNIYNCNTLRGTVDINLYVPVAKTVYGVYSDATDNPNYKGTIDPSEKGKGSVIADDAKVSVNVLGGTHTADIYGIAGSAGAVEAGGEVAICLNGGTANGTFRIGLGTEYSIESGATAACYLTQGTIPAAAIVASTGSETTAVDTFDEGSKLYVEVGDLTYVTPTTAVYPAFVKTSYIKGDVEFVIKGNCVLPATNSKNNFRPLYDVYVGGDYTLKIIPEAGKKFTFEVPFQSSFSSYINGNSNITVDGGQGKNVHFKKEFFGATGFDTVQKVSNATFDHGIFSDRSGSSGRSYRNTAAAGANNVTWELDNITAKYFYPSQYDTAGGGMNIYGKLTNNIQNSTITSTVYMGSYRSYYVSGSSVTQSVPVINEIENNFKGGNTFSGTVYCGGRTASKVEPGYGSINSIVNNITGKNSFSYFYGGSNSSSTYHSESIGSITTTIEEGSTFNTFYAGSKYAWYKEGVQGTITTVINGGTFKNAVYAGNQDGAAAAEQTLTINGGTFLRVYGDGVEMADNADVIILPQISLILNERVEMKALLDKRLVDLYCLHVGTPALTFKLDGKDLGKGFDDLAAEDDVYALILPAASAADFDLDLTYEFDGEAAASTTIQTIAANGASLYAGTPAEAIFKALVDYGSAANGATELKYFDATKLDPALLPAASAPVKGEGAVKIDSVTLLMGDAIGIRFKTQSDLTGINVKVNGERIGSRFYSAKNGAIDIYVSAENLNEIITIEILDAEGTVSATFGYAVSNIASEIYSADNTNLKVAAVLELILAIETAKTAA